MKTTALVFRCLTDWGDRSEDYVLLRSVIAVAVFLVGLFTHRFAPGFHLMQLDVFCFLQGVATPG